MLTVRRIVCVDVIRNSLWSVPLPPQPMGLKSANDIFNRKIDKALEGLQGNASFVDDVICNSSSKAEHDENQRKLLNRTREKGFKFNPEKLVISQMEVKYFSHVLNTQGLSADKDKVSAISNMKTPETRHELETLLGMLTYLTKIHAKSRELTSPMRALS